MSDHEDEHEKTPGLDAPDFALRTERLLIRRFRTDDWRDLYAYLSDPEVVKFEPYPANILISRLPSQLQVAFSLGGQCD